MCYFKFYITIFKNNRKKCFLITKSEIISEGSCGAKDWGNDADNSALLSQE